MIFKKLNHNIKLFWLCLVLIKFEEKNREKKLKKIKNKGK